MERTSQKRRRRTIMLFLASVILPFTQGRIRSTRQLTQCHRYANSPKIVSDYIPSFSYNPYQLATVNGLIYECKPYPFNGWCGYYQPGNVAQPWEDAWILVGECVPGPDGSDEEVMEEQGTSTSNQTSSSIYAVGELDACSTYPLFSNFQIYAADDVVSIDSGIYRCKIAPADAWCSLSGYEPGTGIYWAMAWEKIGECSVGSEISSFSEDVSPGPSCAPLYNPEESYGPHNLISFKNYNYECIVPVWCSERDYAPSDSNLMTAAAWIKKEECHSTITEKPTAALVTPMPMGWVDISSEIVVVPVEEEEPSMLAVLLGSEDEKDSEPLVVPQDEQETIKIRTHRPSVSPSQDQAYSHLSPCAPLYTQGHDYQLYELISFNNHNYQCEVLSLCSQVRYAPRDGAENQGLAWWKIEECHGHATRHPTPRPTPQVVEKPDIDHISYYSSRVPMPMLTVLNENKVAIEKKVLISQTSDGDWEYSSLYTFDDFIVALGVMTEHPVITPFFVGGFGTQSNEDALLYGLVNIAAFLSQSMAESIKFDSCDEANWDFVNNYYPLSNACGQGGESYQDMHCPEEYRHMECPVKKDMNMTATTHAKWLGGADGAPGPLYCAPRANNEHYSGVWDHLYKCNRPHEDPPEVCDVYEGQNAGRYDNSFPALNRASRSDIEGCCWWGRGVIQTRGTCDIGKINYFLGKNADNSPYPNLDFCEDPESLCSSRQHPELKWVAGMASWTMRVQSYNQNSWGYIPQLIKFVDGGMVDDSFIESISGILMRGCHDDSCGEIQPSYERAKNFKTILDDVFSIHDVLLNSGRSFAPTNKPTRRTKKPVIHTPTAKPTRRSRRPTTASPTPPSTYKGTIEASIVEVIAQMPAELDLEPQPTLRPTEWQPWYYNYNTQTCVNDGNQPLWLEQQDFFGIKDECCKKKVGANYDVCMGRVTFGWSAQNSIIEAFDQSDCPTTTGWTASYDCHSYFMCQNGARTGPIYKCSDNFLFDEVTSECKHISEVKCGSVGHTMAIKSEALPVLTPTRMPSHDHPFNRPRPNTRRPTPTPYASTVTQNKKPIASLWFGVSVTAKIQDDDELPQNQ